MFIVHERNRRRERSAVAQLGFIGLGIMGGGIARRLLDAGHTVRGYNRTPEKARALIDAGLVPVGSPREATEGADVVLSMVTGSEALSAIAQGPDGILAALAPGQVWVEMTTCSPTRSRELAERAAAQGAVMLDAPVSGSLVTIQQGKLSIMVGGDAAAFEKVDALLHDIGPVVRHVGVNGQALQLKMALNLSVYLQMVAFSESLLLAEKAGIDAELALEFMLSSVIASPMLQYRARFVLDQPEEAMFDCTMMQKDVKLALEAGRELGMPLPTLAVAGELLTAARALGLGHKDFSIVYEVLARLSGRET
jgi:3-hydroxyisobutyrate dehydrogenase-like beta-hydroxyacid dehydrogenase